MAKYKGKKKYTYAERLAYQFGKVKRGLNNPNSRIAESYSNGLNSARRKKQVKPLF